MKYILFIIALFFHTIISEDKNLSEFKIWESEITVFRRISPSVYFTDVINLCVQIIKEFRL